MKKKKRGIEIKINISQKWLYTLIVIGILIVAGIGVFAYGTSDPSNFGHSIGELEPCELNGENLQIVDGEWACRSYVHFGGIFLWYTTHPPSASCSEMCSANYPSGVVSGSGKCLSSWTPSGEPANCSDLFSSSAKCACIGIAQ